MTTKPNNFFARFTKSKTGYHAVNISSQTPIVAAPMTSGHVDQDKLKLLTLISSNDIKECQHLLNNQIDLQEKERNFLSHPFLKAAKKGHLEIIDLLLEKGADINVQLDSKASSLHLAIRNNHEQCSLFLLQKGIKFKELQDKEGNLPIHLAVKENMVLIVEWILDHDQNINAKNNKKQTVLHFAAMNGRDNLIKVLLCNNVKDDYDRFPLHYAAEKGHELCCNLLLEQKPEHARVTDKEGNSPLILAAKNGYGHCCQSLCSALVRIECLSTDGWDQMDSFGNTALHNAVKKGFIKTIQVLHSFNVDFSIKNEKENTPIHMAALNKDMECFKYLINFINTCPGINNNKQSILHLVVLNSWEEPLKDLLQKDSFKNSINLKDSKNRTALHLAILHSSQECIDILLQNEADFSLLDDELNTPLHLAASKGLIDTCEWILQGSGIQMINWKNKDGETPLHLAAAVGSHSCCNQLLHKGSSIHEKNKKGYTPYHTSAAKGKLEILKLFTKYKRSMINTKVEVSGDSILDISARNGHYECCEYIMNHINRDLILSSLYVSFDSGNDEIFKLILPRCVRSNQKKKISEFKTKLHYFMHEALVKEKQRPIIQRAIIESRWWFSGFSSCFCSEGQCSNFFNLTKLNPEFSRLVLDRCIIHFEGVDVYDFRLLEQDFYIEITDASKSTNLMVAPPYNLETGEFLKESLRHKHSIGYKESALNEAIENGSRNVIQHPLIDGYWEYKWKKYLIYILMGLLFIHVLIITALSLYMLHSWNWTQVNATLQNINTKLQQNGTAPIPYNILGNCSVDLSRVLELPEINLPFLHFLRICLLIITIINFFTEYHTFKKLDFKSYITLGVILRNCRLVLIAFLILPITSCYDQIWIMMTWQWLSGIIALLMSWFHMIYTLNKFPSLSVFMPITSKFAKSFFLVLLYILLIVFIFSFIFYLLFNNHPAFANLGIAFVKTIIWIVGDLAYDDMFLDEEKPILYFAFSNVIFIVFVTSISGFIVNLIITQPTEKFQSFESDAAWNRDSSRITMLLKLDIFYHRLRKRNTIIFWAKDKAPNIDMMRRLMKLYQDDKILPPKTT